jgi:hypothetical protein
MKTRIVEGVEVHRGSGNVFADLGLADAEKLKIKTGLVIEIRKAMKSRGLTQQEAAKRMDCLTRLGYDIEIKVRPAKADVGHLMFAAA